MITTEHPSSARDAWLHVSDTALLRDCREERYKASGPGGQHRNKVATAVRLRHHPSDVVVQAEESRSLEQNRRSAVRRLRRRIAVTVRDAFDLDAPGLPQEIAAHLAQGRLAINPRNPDYPLVVGVVLDALEAAGGSYATAARALGLSTSQLLKFLQSDPEVWREISRLKQRERSPADPP